MRIFHHFSMWQVTYPLVINVTWRLREDHPWTWCRISRLTPPWLLFWFSHTIFICDSYSYVFPTKKNSMYRCYVPSFPMFFPMKKPSTIIGDFPVIFDDSVDGICWSHWDRQLCRESCSIHGIEGAIYPSVIPDQCTFIAGKNIGNYENINKCRF
jgi:hypothetical protein